MDILIHTLSGVSVGTVLALQFGKTRKDQIKLVLLSGLAGALPDIDAISMWSGFDGTFGKFFHLENSGRTIYSSKFWYSHHAFMHSLLASILMGVILAIRPIIQKHWKRAFGVFITCFLAYNVHLFEDMPTPEGPWQGVNYFWPSAEYIGGTGDIWWWNNYDIFLILVSLNIINILIILFYPKIKWAFKRMISPLLWLTACVMIVIQIKSREVNFNHHDRRTAYQSFEEQSKEIQKEILGNFLFHKMEDFDHSMNLAF